MYIGQKEKYLVKSKFWRKFHSYKPKNKCHPHNTKIEFIYDMFINDLKLIEDFQSSWDI